MDTKEGEKIGRPTMSLRGQFGTTYFSQEVPNPPALLSIWDGGTTYSGGWRGPLKRRAKMLTGPRPGGNHASTGSRNPKLSSWPEVGATKRHLIVPYIRTMFYIEELRESSGAIATSTLGDTDVVMLAHPGGRVKKTGPWGCAEPPASFA